jgi:hypothetical protein
MGEIILSWVIGISTFAYMIINIFMLVENQRIRKIKSMPLIVAYLKSTEDHEALRLCIKNIGEGVAKDIKIELTSDYKTFGNENRMLSNLGIMKYGLNIFPPQEQFTYFIDLWAEIGKKKDFENGHIDISIHYAGIDGRKYENTYELPTIQLSGQDYTAPPETYLGKIAYFIEKLSKTMDGSERKM